MKEHDLYPISTLVMICSRKGYILYDRERDKGKRKTKRPAGGSNPDEAKNNTHVEYTTSGAERQGENE